MTKTTDRTSVMSGHEIRIGMDAVLTSLPAVHVLAGQDDARLVVGPVGAFVLVPSAAGRQELLAASHRLEALAGTTREALCAHLAWIPFLDGLIVTSDDPPRSLHITSAALDLLPTVLTEGPRVIDAATIATIRDVIRRSALDGWQAGIRRGDGKIDLCDPVQPTNAH
jgi:hypothetical protein